MCKKEGGGYNTACLLAGRGGFISQFCEHSPPPLYKIGEVGGKFGPSEIDVSSIAPIAIVSSAIGLYENYACMDQNERQ